MVFYLVIDPHSKMPVPTGDRIGFKFYKSLVCAKNLAKRKNGFVLPVETRKMYENAVNFSQKLEGLIAEATDF